MSSETADVADEVVDEVQATSIIEYTPIAAALAELRKQYAGVVFDVSTSRGDKAARDARSRFVELRSRLESLRQDLKRPVLERGRAIDEEAKAITSSLLLLEKPIDAQIKVAEVAKEKARQERIAAEQARIDAIRRRMVDLFVSPIAKVAAGTASEIADAMAWVERTAADSSFEDLQLEAETLRSAYLDKLRAMHSAAVLHERQAAERLAEQARLEAEAAERRRAEAAEREAQRAAEKALDEALTDFRVLLGAGVPSGGIEAIQGEIGRVMVLRPPSTLDASRRGRANIDQADRLNMLAGAIEQAEQQAENDRLRAENARLAAEKASRERAEAEAKAQQEAIDRAHRETQERIAREEAAERQRRRDAEQAALDRVRAAAPQMLDALRAAHPIVYAARAPIGPHNADEAVRALALIDAAIAAATAPRPTTTESTA